MRFTGVFTALVTPFANGHVDETAFRDLVEWQIEQGIHGLVPCGTTGESATLTVDEHLKVIELCVEQSKGRVPVLAGAGSNNTLEAIHLVQSAKDAGADGALLITPYYNKPTQEGLFRHFGAVAEAVDFPLVPYNVPGRTGCNMLPATIGRLAAAYRNIVAIKEATGNLKQGSEVIQACPAEFSVLSGDDFTALPLWCVGGNGVISVTANIMPARMSAMWNAFAAGDLATARAIHDELFTLHDIMFVESNPIPVKTALSLMGRMNIEMRLPLCPMNDAHTAALTDELRKHKLI